MKIKLFSSNDHAQLEKSVNDFIKDKEVYAIEYQSMWMPTQMNGPRIESIDIVDRVLVRYEESEVTND